MQDHRKLDQLESEYNDHLRSQTRLHQNIRDLQKEMHEAMDKIQNEFERKIKAAEAELDRHKRKVPELERNINNERLRLEREARK